MSLPTRSTENQARSTLETADDAAATLVRLAKCLGEGNKEGQEAGESADMELSSALGRLRATIRQYQRVSSAYLRCHGANEPHAPVHGWEDVQAAQKEDLHDSMMFEMDM